MNATVCDPFDLSTRSNGVTLPPAGTVLFGLTQEPVRLITAEATKATWRIVSVQARRRWTDPLDPVTFPTQRGAPFGARLQWSGGDNVSQVTSVTCGAAFRACLFARTVIVDVWSMFVPGELDVVVSIADGYRRTRNIFDTYHFAADISPPTDVPVPALASRVRSEITNVAGYAARSLSMFDGAGVLRSSVPLSAQPDEWTSTGLATVAEADLVTPGRIAFRLEI